MAGKIKGSQREFGRIQINGRISIPKPFREALGWEDGDQVMMEIHLGEYILVENLSAKWRKS